MSPSPGFGHFSVSANSAQACPQAWDQLCLSCWDVICGTLRSYKPPVVNHIITDTVILFSHCCPARKYQNLQSNLSSSVLFLMFLVPLCMAEIGSLPFLCLVTLENCAPGDVYPLFLSCATNSFQAFISL